MSSAAGHTLVGVDISPRQVELARANVPGATLLEGDMAAAEFDDCSVDAAVSFYAIGHLPREQHAEVLARVGRWLRPGGWLLLSEEDVDRLGIVGDWLGVGMFFSGRDAEAMLRLVRGAGFVVERWAAETQLEQGREVPFTWLLARKPD